MLLFGILSLFFFKSSLITFCLALSNALLNFSLSLFFSDHFGLSGYISSFSFSLLLLYLLAASISSPLIFS